MSSGTKEDPWVLRTPPGSSEYTMYRDEEADPPSLVCQVGSTTLTYRLTAIDNLHAWLTEQGDWVPLGAADEKKPAAPGTVEAWGRSPDNPVGGWYGLRNGYRGRIRDVPATAAGGARAGRAHPRISQQPDARQTGFVNRVLPCEPGPSTDRNADRPERRDGRIERTAGSQQEAAKNKATTK